MKTISSFSSKLLALTLALTASVASFAYEFEYVNDFHIDGFAYKIIDRAEPCAVALIEVADCEKHVTIPESVIYNDTTFIVTTMGMGNIVFSGTAQKTMESLYIPKTIMIINYRALGACPNLMSIVVDEENKYLDSRNNCNAVISSNDTYRPANQLVAGCKTTVIPNSVTEIGNYAFVRCETLENIIIPEGVTTIRDGAFYECTSLSSIKLPESLTQLTQQWIFGGCTSLEEVFFFAKTPPYIAYGMFIGITPTIYVPEESLDAYKKALYWQNFDIQAIPYKSQWCDTWNVMWFDGLFFDETASTSQYRLGKDTVIGNYTYSKFTSRTSVRFTNDRKVYVYYEGFDDNDPYSEDLPTGEYLAYDFSAQVGDTLEVFSGVHSYSKYKCLVREVQTDPETKLRTITLFQLLLEDTDGDGVEEEYGRGEMTWIEGVGSPNGFLINTTLPGGGLFTLLCAYKDDELKYTGSFYERFGCEYNAGVVSDDLFPTLSGLQRTICREYCEQSDNKTRIEQFTNLTTRTETGGPYLYCSPFLLREKDNKILIYSRSLNKDLVLYDFNLQVGDSLPMLYIDFFAKDDWIPDSDMKIWCVVDYHKDLEGNILPADTLIVTDVSAITLLDGKEYKKWTFDNGMEYVEGIGSFGNDQWSGDFFQLIGNMDIPVSLHGEHLVCASRNNKLLYQMDDTEMERLGTECLCDVEKKWSDTWCDTWNIMEHNVQLIGDYNEETWRHYLAEDTTINGTTYTTVNRYWTADKTKRGFVATIRFTEDQKVYALLGDTEYLVYDFSVQVGDTIETIVGVNCGTMLQRLLVHQVDIDDATNRKTITLYPLCKLEEDVDCDRCDENGYYLDLFPIQWIEGVGSTDGFLMGDRPCSDWVGGIGHKLLCAYKDDELQYINDLYQDDYGCEYNAVEQNPENLFPTLWGLQRTEVEYHTDGADAPSLVSFEEYTPTFVNGKWYLYDGMNYLREENNQVLLYSPEFEIYEDVALYDWALEIGDTLPFTIRPFDDDKSRGAVFRVTDVSTITLLDGKEYKKWTLACGIEYIEGIGAINGEGFGNYFCIQHVAHPATYIDTRLVCASRNGKLLYQMDDTEMERLGAECLCEAENPEDLFPTLWGLQRTGCTKTIGENENGTVWGSRSYLMQEIETATIGGKQYLLFGTNNIYDEYCSLWLREENNKILVYSTAQKKDLVLYDFTLNVGDSLSRLYVDYELSSVVDYDNDEWGLAPLVVTEVSTITLLDGQEHKKWTFNNGMQYVEGIGSFGTCYAHNDFYQLIANAPLYSDVHSQHLVCVSKNGKLLYQMDDAEMERLGAECLCDYDSGHRKDNAKDGQIGGRPTPTQWNQLEVVLREMDNNHTILQAETFSYTLEDISQQVNNKTYFQLARQSTKDTATTKSVVGALHFGKDEDNRVYFLRDGVEYVLYDFTAEPGDTVEIFAGINNYPQETTYTHVVTGKDTLENGACRMLLEVVFPDETNTTAENAEKVWLAGLGSVDGIVHNAAKRASNAPAAPSRTAHSSDTQTSVMLCAWREDSCLYTTDHPDYDSFGCVYNQDPTSVENTHSPLPMTDYQKLLRNGQLLIIHKGKTYNVLGVAVE